MSKLEALFQQFQKAVARLKDVLEQEKNEYIRDSAIQRFEFTFDLSWKLIKTFLEENRGIICASPKGCFREAYTQSVLDYDECWIEMTDTRNKTAHIYKEEFADEIYSRMSVYLNLFNGLIERLEKLKDN
ncbi:nucleotidyltransferase substrate binding protein [Patescibacteria group bacterium]|nr:nucleotidyltransferase substrate binding protein [Patescibacteria group bacterium]